MRFRTAFLLAGALLITSLEVPQADSVCGQSESGWHQSDIVGTHGRHGLPKFFLGSVAERMVATAPCPVVTVRAT